MNNLQENMWKFKNLIRSVQKLLIVVYSVDPCYCCAVRTIIYSGKQNRTIWFLFFHYALWCCDIWCLAFNNNIFHNQASWTISIASSAKEHQRPRRYFFHRKEVYLSTVYHRTIAFRLYHVQMLRKAYLWYLHLRHYCHLQ